MNNTPIIDCKTAEDLITLLVVRRSPLHDDPQLYRGVSIGTGDQEHKLIPTSLRGGNPDPILRLSGDPLPSSTSQVRNGAEQARCEARILGEFFRYADANGLPMPEITSRVRRAFQTRQTTEEFVNNAASMKKFWPSDDLLPITGQAQHYGLPTRLLDWTLDPWVAMFFAARGAIRRMIRCSDATTDCSKFSIAIWAFDAPLVLLSQQKQPHASDIKFLGPIAPLLSIVTAPASTNPNLRAQQGVFTVWRTLVSEGHTVNRTPLDELVSQSNRETGGDFPLFRKYTLPYAQVEELWRILRHNQINSAKYFPGFDGAANAVKEHAEFYSFFARDLNRPDDPA